MPHPYPSPNRTEEEEEEAAYARGLAQEQAMRRYDEAIANYWRACTHARENGLPMPPKPVEPRHLVEARNARTWLQDTLWRRAAAAEARDGEPHGYYPALKD